MEENKKEEGVPSPYPLEDQFDYNKFQDETTIRAMENIFKTLGENAHLMVFNHDSDPSKISDNVSDMSLKLMGVLIDYKVPVRDLSKISDNIQQMLSMIFQEISKQKNGFENELLARTIKSKDPGNQDYSEDYATIGDIFTRLKEVRTEQGDPNGEHYWKIQKKSDTIE